AIRSHCSCCHGRKRSAYPRTRQPRHARMTLPTFAHPWFLLLFLLLPVLAWLKGKRGQQSAFLYSSVQLVRPVANISQWSPGRVLLALRWLVLAVMIIALARPQLTRSETSVRASGVDIVMAIDLSGSMAA